METTLDDVDGDGRRRLRLQGELTIYAAGAVRTALIEALEGASELEVDLAGVTELDTAGLQLLLAAKRDALAAGTVLRMAGHGVPVLDLLDLYELAGWFGDPLVLPAQTEGAAA